MEENEIGHSLRRWLQQQKRKWRDMRENQGRASDLPGAPLSEVGMEAQDQFPQSQNGHNGHASPLKGGPRLASFNRLIADQNLYPPSRDVLFHPQPELPYSAPANQLPMILSVRPSKPNSGPHCGGGVMNLRGINPEPHSVWPPRPSSFTEHPIATTPPFTLSSLRLNNGGNVEATAEELCEYWTSKQARVQQEFVNRRTRQLEFNLKRGSGGDRPAAFWGFECEPRSATRASDLAQPRAKVPKRVETEEEPRLRPEIVPGTLETTTHEDPTDVAGLSLLLSLAT